VREVVQIDLDPAAVIRPDALLIAHGKPVASFVKLPAHPTLSGKRKGFFTLTPTLSPQERGDIF
jgi:hypothetical protein